MATGSGARRAGMWAIDQARAGQQQADEQLRGGFDTAASLYGRSQQRLGDLYDAARPGFVAYGDRAGINGAEGDTRAMQGFDRSVYGKAGEEYGTQGVMRQAGAMGSLGSGRAFGALGDFLSRNRADNYTKYAALAQPYLSVAPAIAGQMGQMDAGLAGLAQQTAQQRANLTNQTYQTYGQAGGNALSAGDAVRSANQQTMMQGVGLGLQGLGALAGFGGFGGLGGLMGGASGMSTMGSQMARPMATGGLY